MSSKSSGLSAIERDSYQKAHEAQSVKVEGTEMARVRLDVAVLLLPF